MTKKPSLVVVRSLVVLGLAAALWTRSGQPVGAQGGITITSPAANAVMAAGPDFATDTLSDPWDFSNREDVAIDPAQIHGLDNFSVNTSTGLAGGTVVTSARGTHFFTLQRGYYGILNPGRTGRRYPIGPSTYTKLAFKMNTSGANAAGQFPRVYWFHNDLGDPGGDASGWRYTDPNTPAPTGNQIFVLDLTQGNQNSIDQGVPWTSGAVKGLALYPNSNNVGYDVQYDWVRLTTGDSNAASPSMPITWQGTSSNVTIQVVAQDGSGATYTIATGFNGNSYSWKYGFLPPGSYMLKVGNAQSPFRINAPPTFQITDPDESGGEDFATAVLGNTWDMNDTADYKVDPLTINDHLTSRSVFGGLFTGRSDGVEVARTTGTPPIPVGDPQMYFLSKGKDTDTTVIDTNKYHRLTFAQSVARTFDLERGSVARVFWGSATSPSGGGPPYNVTTTKDIITWPGMNTYSVDLATLSAAADGGLETANATLWTARNVRHFRIDPHEFAEQLDFQYDFVKLAADDATTSGSFTIRFTGSDPDGDAATVALYYDSDLNPGAGLTLITSNVPLSTGQYVWNAAQVPSGTYYVYAVASDGRNAVGQYASGPVKVVGFTPVSNGFINVDTPAPSATVTSAFEVGGWALDQGAPSGTGVDAVQFYVFPNAGAGAPVFIGTGSYGATRTDVGSIFGSQFNNSGFHFTITGMGPGDYVLGVYAHSTVTNAFSIVKTVPFTVNANALMSIDVPAAEMTITSPTFGVSGWAIDRAIEGTSTTGTGVDTLHVYAYPNPGSGLPAIFLGVASVGIARSDVAALYGSRYTGSGYVLQVDRAALGLPPGVYNIVPVARSTASNTFNNLAIVRVTLQ